MSLSFEDLSEFDLLLIKSNAINTYVTTKQENRYQILAQCVLECIYSKGYDVKFESKKLLEKLTISLEPAPLYRGSTYAQPAIDIIRSVFDYFKTNGIEIVQDQTRTPTWAKPNPGWYQEQIPQRNWWKE